MPYLRKYTPPKQINHKARDRVQIYNSNKWRKLRLSQLMQQPLCELCLLRGKTTLAVDVHHKDSFLNYNGDKRYAVAYDPNNLMSLCKECHAELHKNGTTHGFNKEEYAPQCNSSTSTPKVE